MTQRLLVIPHVGTAFGHLLRTGEVLRARFGTGFDIHVAVPATALDVAARHMPSKAKLLPYEIRPTVTSLTGRLDVEGFVQLLNQDLKLALEVRPDALLGDPGIRTGLLGEKLRKPWSALMHGCFLPLPAFPKVIASQWTELAQVAWKVTNRMLDGLVRMGSESKITSWADLRSRGSILIPNLAQSEPCPIGEHLGSVRPLAGFESGSPYPCVVTACSAGDTEVPSPLLLALVRQHGRVAVVGARPAAASIAGVDFLGSDIATSTLVDSDTTVITHGGHGTLQAVRHARRVIILPGDVDQLCNALIAHTNWGAELAVGLCWFERLTSDAPLKRSCTWSDLDRFLSL